MKNCFIKTAVLLLCAAVFISCSKDEAKPQNQELNIAVSSYVPYTFAKSVLGDAANLTLLIPPGVEAHAFEPSPKTIKEIKQAQIFFYTSNFLEPWALKLDKNAVMLAENLPQVLPQDPHVWMNFDSVRILARRTAELLAQINPQQASIYQANLKNFEQELTALDKEFTQGLAHCDNREIVHIGHLAFGPLAKRYGLELFALSGSSHEGEHSVRRLADLVQHIRRKKIHALFTEDAVSPRLAEAVAAETGVDILTLHTIEHVSKNDFNQEVSYVEFMHRNLESLQRGLSCRL